MTPEEVETVISNEVSKRGMSLSEPSNLHGVRLDRCLVRPPMRQKYLIAPDEDSPVLLWLVLEEDPETHEGYQIVFDEDGGDFGLAVRGTPTPVVIGFYGGFVDTLRGM